MNYANDVLDPELAGNIQTDLERFSKEWQADATIGTPEPIAAFCDVLLRGGKRLRGVLAIKSYQAFGGSDESVAMGAARVFEIIQTSLLVVDDIADRSALRRGGPSAHALLETWAAKNNLKGSAHQYGQVQAMNVAYAGVHKAALELLLLGTDPETVRRTCAKFHENILVTVNGQIDDIFNEATPNLVDEAAIESVMRRKTAFYSMLSPLELGAQLAGVAELPAALREYAVHAGSAYQISDDIISTFGRENETGKGSNDDLREGKLTLLAYYALAHGTPKQTKRLKRILGNEQATNDDCDEARKILLETGAVDYAKKQLAFHKSKALTALKGAPAETPITLVSYLRRLTEYLVDRNS
jgi:geranylgeranyl diphosphate synthase type I